MYRLTFIICCLIIFSNSSAQNFYEHEIGINTGFYQLRSDYGINEDSETNFGNQGVAFSLSYYLNLASRRDARYFFEHFKYRFNFMYASVDLQHYGPFVSDPRLASMTGTFSNIGISNGFEYYPFGIKIQSPNRYITFFQKLSPYTGIGFGLNFVTPDAESSLPVGLDDPENVFPTFLSNDTDNGIILDDRVVASLNLRLGLRYDFNIRTGIMVESSWMLFGSDLVDGLSPVGPQNKNNDWSWGINVGFYRLMF